MWLRGMTSKDRKAWAGIWKICQTPLNAFGLHGSLGGQPVCYNRPGREQLHIALAKVLEEETILQLAISGVGTFPHPKSPTGQQLLDIKNGAVIVFFFKKNQFQAKENKNFLQLAEQIEEWRYRLLLTCQCHMVVSFSWRDFSKKKHKTALTKIRLTKIEAHLLSLSFNAGRGRPSVGGRIGGGPPRLRLTIV